MARTASENSAGCVSLAEVEEVSKVLEQEANVVERLLAAARRKREAILARDRTGIERAVHDETALLTELDGLEAERARWLERRLNAGNHGRNEGEGAPQAPSTLRALLECFPDEQAREVRRIADHLAERLGELDHVNRENAGLLFHALAFVEAMVAAIVEPGKRGRIYGPGRAADVPGANTILDWRA